MRTLRCLAYREGAGWTAECLELGLAVHGDTLQEARHALDEAIEYLASELARLRREGTTPVVRRVPCYFRKRMRWWLDIFLRVFRRTSREEQELPAWRKAPNGELATALV